MLQPIHKPINKSIAAREGLYPAYYDMYVMGKITSNLCKIIGLRYWRLRWIHGSCLLRLSCRLRLPNRLRGVGAPNDVGKSF